MISLSDKNSNEMIEIRQLWSDCFHDSEGFMNYYFNNIVKKNKIVVMKENKKVVGMIHLNPYVFSKDGKRIIRTYYIVGVAVGEAYRREGRMKKMMEYVAADMEEEHIPFVYLWPKDVHYYESMGYKTVTNIDRVILKKENLKKFAELLATDDVDLGYMKLFPELYRALYSGNEFSAELASENGRFIKSVRGEHNIGSFSMLKNEDIISVEHFCPVESLKQLIAELIEQLLKNGDFKQAEISIDRRLTDCLGKSKDAVEINEDHVYMVKILKDTPDKIWNDCLFTEVV